MSVTFTTILIQAEGKNATGISVPPDAVAALGSSKKPPVKVNINSYRYRSTIAAYGDVFMLPVSAEHRTAAGLKAGDEINVTFELDTEPRTVEVPEDLATALAEKAGAREAFDNLAPSKRKEHVRQVTSAKAEETRQRRITTIVEKLP